MTPERFERIRRVLAHRQPDMAVVMDNVNKLHNLSAIARTCDAVGIGDIHAVTNDRSIRLAHKAASGTSNWITTHTHDSIDSLYAELRAYGMTILAAHIGDDALDFRQVNFLEPFALVVGAELEGISQAAVAMADNIIRVPLVGMVESLNVSVATALILFEAQRQRSAAGFYDKPRLAPGELAKLEFEWAHPRIAGYCRKHHLDYPELDGNGELVEPLPKARKEVSRV